MAKSDFKPVTMSKSGHEDVTAASPEAVVHYTFLGYKERKAARAASSEDKGKDKS